MRKFCFAFVFALLACAGSSFALSSDDCTDNFHNSAPADSVGDYMLDAVSYAVTSDGWTVTDRNYLNEIRLALTSSNPGTLFNYVFAIKDSVSNSYNKLFDIKRNTDYLPNISNNTNDVKSLLTNVKSFLNQIDLNTRTHAWTTEQAATVTLKTTTLTDFFTSFSVSSVPYFQDGSGEAGYFNPYLTNLGFLSSSFLYDTTTFWNGGLPTFYGLVHRLQETLASDDDKALADSQKSNRDQIKHDFVSGSSGKTSLGASDFGDLSSVGGSVKDSISLNGQSSVSGFTGGLSDSDAAGLGWFSASTRDALDTVTSSSTSSSSYARRSSDDTYNMSGFAENYSWLYGE